MSGNFIWVWKKINHAKARLSELEVVIKEFMNADVSIDIHYENGKTHVIARPDFDLIYDIAIKTGELNTQLRGALDKMIAELALSHSGYTGSGVAYPFGGFDHITGELQPFPSRPHIRGNLEKWVGASATEYIISQNPQPGGNDTLWSINQIANADKHKAGFIKAVVLPRSFRFKIPFPSNPTLGQSNMVSMHSENFPKGPHAFIDEEKFEQVLMTIDCETQPRAQHRCTAEVCFGDFPPMKAGESILPHLSNQIAEVERIGRDLSSFF